MMAFAMLLIAVDRIADSVDTDQVQSDLGLHYLFKPICLNITWEHNSMRRIVRKPAFLHIPKQRRRSSMR